MNYIYWVAVSTSMKNFKAGMWKFASSAQHYSMPYLLLPDQGNHLSAELQFQEMVVMKTSQRPMQSVLK